MTTQGNTTRRRPMSKPNAHKKLTRMLEDLRDMAARTREHGTYGWLTNAHWHLDCARLHLSGYEDANSRGRFLHNLETPPEPRK